MNKAKKVVGFVNAQEMAKKHPDTFEVPSLEELNNIKKGDTVKVCENGERFWVNITHIEGDSIKGIVDNNLVCYHSFNFRDTIDFKKENIYSIY